MRLDHLLSKELRNKKVSTLVSKSRYIALFDFEDAVEKQLREPNNNGGVAQLGEHLPCTQRVRSSILLISTKKGRIAQVVRAHA